MKRKSALVVVDVQYDFLREGSLEVPDGDEIIPVINNIIDKFPLVVFTRDFHPADHGSFASQHPGKRPFDIIDLNGIPDQVLWPDHCVQGTRGSHISENLDLGKIKGDFYVFKKGTDPKVDSYSAFKDNGGNNSTGLDYFLDKKGVTDVFVTGLAGDFCVEYTCIDSANLGFNTVLIKDATRYINKNQGPSLMNLYEAKVSIIESWELDLYKMIIR